jgi:two-component system chemotaxis sensor kinase CheA
MDDFEIELKNDFLQEASDLLQNTEQSFLALENDPTNKALVDSIFRFAHNLKGTSRAVGFGQIAELTHKAENLLLEIKNGKVTVTAGVVSILLLFNDKVREMITGLKENLDAQFDSDLLMEELGRIAGAPQTASAPEPALSEVPESAPSPEAFVENGAEPETSEPQIAAPKVVAKREARKEDETLRVSLGRLEKLNDLVGELVILQSLVEGSLSRVNEHKTARSLGKLCKDIQELTMSLRMVPVGPTFQKLTRIVRDTSKLLGKKVDLRLIGEETEIDKTVVESIGDPLVHIIRNAIDHGLETPEERLLAGKPEVGVVEVMAFHEGNFLVIQITDDGKGIDPEKLISKAKGKGIIPENAQLSDQQGIELIFNAGFSTKEVVSEVSGRGVGMDVVKTNIELLGGEVKVRSRVGSGSCFRLMLPLTLAIIEGMLIEAGEQRFIIPKGQVQEVIRLHNAQITSVTGRSPYLSLRNEILPLFFLENDLGTTKKSESLIAIVVTHGDLQFAVGISDIIQQQQVVVKPATKEIAGRVGIMGTTILGDGRPALIIDLLSLYARKVRKENGPGKTAAA